MIQPPFASLCALTTRLSNLVLLVLLSLGFVACGGSNSDLQSGTLEAPTERLESFVIQGGELSSDFESERTGIYDIEMDEGVESLNITATVTADTPADSRVIIFDASARTSICIETTVDIDVSSGTAFDFPIEEGNNKFILRLTDSEYSQCVDYIFNVSSVGSSVSLPSVSVSPVTAVFSGVDAENTAFSGDIDVFDPTILSYDVAVPYTSCALAIIPRTLISGKTLTFDGSPISSSGIRFLALEPGVQRAIPIEVTSSDGSASQTYTFNVTRTAAVDSDLLEDPYLKAVSLTNNGQLIEEFQCFSESISAQVNSDVEMVDLSLTKSAPNSTMTYELFVDDEYEEALAVPDDGIVTDLALTSGSNILRIVVTSGSDADIPPTRTYLINIVKTTTDWVYVDTATDLQQALLNAQANQEIVIRRGIYTGLASLAESGSDSAHFFSAASGTEEQAITLRGLSAGAVTLRGDDLSGGNVLELSGDYWQVANLQIENAQTGLVLNGANNNTVDSVIVSDVGERGIHLRNDSSNNTFSKVVVSNTGAALVDGDAEIRAEALVVGSDDSDWLEATPAGEDNSTAENNRFFNMVFGDGIVSELVDIKEGSLGTELAYSILSANDVRQAEANTAVVIKGNDVKLHHNTFSRRNASVLDSMIATRDASEDFHTEAWGENAEIFSNTFNMNTDQTAALVDGGEATTVFVADNERTDSIAAVYIGAGIDESFESPAYRIQTFTDETLCLIPGTIEVAEGLDELEGQRMVLGSCSEQTSEWKIIHEGNNTLVFESVLSAEKVAASLTLSIDGSVVAILSESFLAFYTNTGGSFDLGDFLRWSPSFSSDRVRITSASNSLRSMTVTTLGELVAVDNFADPDANVVVLAEADGAPEQSFRFVEVD